MKRFCSRALAPMLVFSCALPFFFLSGCQRSAHDESGPEIHALFKSHQYGSLFRLSRRKALKGDPMSEFVQGYLYEHGLGVSPDLGKAVFWYQKAASDGNRQAMNDLGVLYENGIGVDRSVDRAQRWFQRSADLGNPAAYNNLGVLLLSRRPLIERVKKKAARDFRFSAHHGNADAMNNLGLLYLKGEGVPQDRRKARIWLEKASALGLSEAQNALSFRRESSGKEGSDEEEDTSSYDEGSGSTVPDEKWISRIGAGKPPASVHKDWVAVVIGVDHYLLKGIPNAEYAGNDARSVSALLTRLGWTTVLLENANASYFSIKNRILVWKGYPLKRFLVYFSGHGTLSSDGISGLAPSDILPSGEGAIPMKTLTGWIGTSLAKQKYLLVDACFSGGKRFFFPKGARPLVMMKPRSPSLPGLLEMDASLGNQESHVDPVHHHGLFTEIFLQEVRKHLPYPTWENIVNGVSTDLPFEARMDGFSQNPEIRPANSPLLSMPIGSSGP